MIHDHGINHSGLRVLALTTSELADVCFEEFSYSVERDFLELLVCLEWLNSSTIFQCLAATKANNAW